MLRPRPNLPTKIGLIACLMFVSMADSCVSECRNCNTENRNSEVIVTFPDNTSIKRSADGNGCVEYDKKAGSCGTVSNLYGNSGDFTSSPNSIDLQSPPTTFTVTGDGLDTTYGMPVVEFFDWSGSMVGSATATSVNGTTLTATTPNLWNAYSGYWVIAVFNQTSSGLVYLGSGEVEATGRDYQYCNPTEEQVSNCEMAMGHWWNYDTCTCVDGNH